MSFRHLAIILSLLICVSGKSLTLVVDTTHSMKNEMSLIKSQMAHMLGSIGNAAAIDNYVIVPFNNPDVGPVQIFTTQTDFLNSLNSLKVSGAHNIPQNSLSGIEKALQESKLESDIFLFTDACAKDETKFNDIQQLCRNTRSKVIVFMSGTCPYSDTNSFGKIMTYYQVTKVCFGNFFQLDLTNYDQAFRFMSEIVNNDYNDVKPFELFTGSREKLPFSVDTLTRDAIVAVTGGSPGLTLYDETGQSPRTHTLIETQRSLVVRIMEPRSGQYWIDVGCQGLTSVTVYKKIDFPLEIGFSPLYPWSIAATTPKPLPGRNSFIFVLVPKRYRYTLNTMTINVLNGEPNTMPLTESGVNSRIYITQAYFQPGSKFRLTVNAIDSTSETVQFHSKAFESQTEVTNVPWSAAVIQNIVPEFSLTYYKKNATVACKVSGCPQPAIWWEDESGQNLKSQSSFLEYPATYISYVTIPSITENKTVTCKASTSIGKDSRTIQLYVYRPYVFEMVQIPKDTTIEYETEGKIICEVNAYPEAQLSWYHNGNIITFTTNETDDDDRGSYNTELEYFQEDNALVIKNMTSAYVGEYTCDVRNDANNRTYSFEIEISGLEPPELETSDTELTTKVGESVEILCRIFKGTPLPTLSWSYKPVNAYDFADLPDGVEVDGEKITISEVTSQHKGIYKCVALNEKGQSDREIVLRVTYAPKIENPEPSTVNVLLGKSVVLECSVDAEPKASILWKRSDGVSFPDDTHTIEGNFLKFEAHSNDSGFYSCIAENEAGSAQKDTTVNVQVLPYITPVLKQVFVRAGNPFRLSCNVQDGKPTPTILWRYTDLDFKTVELPRDKTDLIIPRIRKSQSGTYVCKAENIVGYDTIQIAVVVE